MVRYLKRNPTRCAFSSRAAFGRGTLALVGEFCRATGLTLARRGEYPEAIDAYRKAIEQRGGNHPWAYHNLGIALLRRGDFNESVDSFNRAIEQRNGEFPKAWHNLGIAQARRGDLEQAAAAFRRRLTSAMAIPRHSIRTGRVMERRGDFTAQRSDTPHRAASLAVPASTLELSRALFGWGQLEKR